MALEILILVTVLAFVLEYFDAGVGMGFGIMTPALILLGFSVLEVVPAVILASTVLSLSAAFFHHAFRNVDLSHDSKEFKITLVLTGFGIVAIFIGAVIAVNLPAEIVKVYIGLLMAIIGVVIFVTEKQEKHKFSWFRLIGLGSVASFNKGVTGGGYGPVLAGGQILTGVSPKKAVGITAFSEGIISLAAIITYFILDFAFFNWPLTIALIIGGGVGSPLAAFTVSKIEEHYLRISIATLSILLGLGVIFEIIFRTVF